MSKYVWDNIAQENYLCNIGPERTDVFLQENTYAMLLLWSAWANIAQNNYLHHADNVGS